MAPPRIIDAILSHARPLYAGREVKNKTIPMLWDWVRLIVREFHRNHCLMHAAVLSFATVLSLVPMLAIVFTFFDLFGGGDWLAGLIKPYLISSLAVGVGDKALAILDRLLVKVPIGALGTMGFLLLAYSGLGLLNKLENSFNYIWKVTQGRSFFARFRNFWVMVTLVPLLILASLVATSSVHWGETMQQLLSPWMFAVIRSWLAPLFLEWLGILLLFELVPNIKIRFLPAALGAFLGSILWEGAKRLFLFYAAATVGSNPLYGAFTALPLFFIWLNITFVILLLALEATYITQNFRQMRRFSAGAGAEEASPQGVALNLLMDVAHRHCSGQPPLRVNSAAARFDLRAPDFKRLLNKLIEAKFILRPNSDNDYLNLANDPQRISLAGIFDLLGKVPPEGLPLEVSNRLMDLENKRRSQLQDVSLGDLVASGQKDGPA